MQWLVAARMVVNFTSAVVPILVSRISAERLTIPNGKVQADDIALNARRIDLQELSTLLNCCVALVSTTDASSSPSPNLVAKALKNAAESLVPEQRVLLERLLRKHASACAAGPTNLDRTSLKYHRRDRRQWSGATADACCAARAHLSA